MLRKISLQLLYNPGGGVGGYTLIVMLTNRLASSSLQKIPSRDLLTFAP
jgi:hypothetical protein